MERGGITTPQTPHVTAASVGPLAPRALLSTRSRSRTLPLPDAMRRPLWTGYWWGCSTFFAIALAPPMGGSIDQSLDEQAEGVAAVSTAFMRRDLARRGSRGRVLCPLLSGSHRLA